MRLYVYVSILALLLYPLLCLFFWETDLSSVLLHDWFGIALCIGVGLFSSLVLLVTQWLSPVVPVLFRPTFIRLGAAEVVGSLSVAQIIFMAWAESGEYLSVNNFWWFLHLQIPAFLAAFIAYHIAGLLIKRLAPPSTVQAKPKRR